jgi:hypothetical protein
MPHPDCRSIFLPRPAGWRLAHDADDRGYIPRWARSIKRPRPAGYLLAHGSLGFYGFYIPPGKGWTRCRCGWRTDLGPHYAHPDVACRDASLLTIKDKIY